MRSTNQHAGFIAALCFLAGSLFAASLGGKVQAATAKNPGQDNAVISEFRSRGITAGFEVYDDFVELFNPSGHDIDISGWYIKSVSNSGVYRAQYQFASGTLLAPGQHYLIAGNYYSGTVPPDGTFATGGIADNGGVALTDPDGMVLDMAGVSLLSAEGTPLDPLVDNLDQSYERRPGGPDGSCYDSDDNSADFLLRAPGDPQNSAETTPLTVCLAATETPPSTSTPTGTPTDVHTATETGTPTSTDTPAGTATQTGTPTITPTSTHTGTPTKTPTFTHTRIPSNTLPPTSTPSSTNTEKPTRTSTHSQKPSSSRTPTFTRTPSLTKTPTSTRTSTLPGTFTNTRTFTFTRSPSNTRTPSLTRTITATRTATFTKGTSTRTRTPTPRPGFMAINEVLPYPQSDWNEDGQIDAGDEYIELINLGATKINIKNWTLDTGERSPSFSLLNLNVLPRQILVFFHFETGLGLGDSGGSVRLLKPDGSIADIYTYPPVQAGDRSGCLLENGSGPQFACRPSPGRPNIAYEPVPVAPNNGGICMLTDSVPQEMAWAECNGPGRGVWNEPVESRLWLNKLWKWDLFLE